MLIKTTVIWLLERLTELVAGAFLCLIIFGRSLSDSATYLEEMRINLLAVGFFYMVSGYIFSCLALGLISRRSSPLAHGIKMAAFFIGHSVVFFLFIGSGASFPVLAIALGTIIVFLVNSAGSAILSTERR